MKLVKTKNYLAIIYTLPNLYTESDANAIKVFRIPKINSANIRSTEKTSSKLS